MKRTYAVFFPVIRIFLAALVIVAIGGGGYFYYQSRAAGTGTASTGSYTQAVQVKQGDLSSTISVVGQLAAEQSSSLVFAHMSGTAKLLTLGVQAGNTVTATQVLATIDSASYQQALDQAKSDLQAAEETLADLKAPATALEIAQADAAIATAEKTVEQAKSDLADLSSPDLTSLENAVKDAEDNLKLLQIQSDLAERDSLAKSERDLRYNVNWYGRRIASLEAMTKRNAEQTAEITTDQEILAADQADLDRVFAQRELARQARADELAKDKVALADAQEALAKAKAGGDKLTLAQAQLAVHEAEVSLQAAQEARKDLDLDTGTDATELATAQAAVDKKRLAVSEAETALAGTQLLAPFDGTILETNVAVGDQVTANTTVLTLANLKTTQVVASVDETTIRQVSEGQAATIAFDAFPGQSFTGKVLSVPLQGTLQGGVMVYDVPISLTGAEDLALLVGMTANVDIQVGQVTDALLVPTIALQQSNGLYEVLVPNTADPSGDPEAVPVEVGLSDGTYTQITKGLNAGDNVLVQLQSTSSSSSSKAMGGSGNVLMSASRALSGR
jgi:HlyD family secretion protein